MESTDLKHLPRGLSRLRLGNLAIRTGSAQGFRSYGSILAQGTASIMGYWTTHAWYCSVEATNGRSRGTSLPPNAIGRSVKTIMPLRDYKDGLMADLRDPEFAVAYLNAALEDDSPQVFLLHLRDVAEAWGGLGNSPATPNSPGKRCIACSVPKGIPNSSVWTRFSTPSACGWPSRGRRQRTSVVSSSPCWEGRAGIQHRPCHPLHTTRILLDGIVTIWDRVEHNRVLCSSL